MHRSSKLTLAVLAAFTTSPALAVQAAAPASVPSTEHKLPNGVDLSLDFVGNVASNPVGGVEHGTEGSYWFMAQGKFDLGKLWGWTGTTLDTQAAWFAGRNLVREKVGSSISAQQTWRPVDGGRLTRLTLTHKFDNGLTIMAGRAPVNSYFNNSPLNCVFMSNAMCLTTYGPIADIGITAYPNSSWAGLVRFDFKNHWYVQTGAFDYNNKLNVAGKNGIDFSWNEGTGTVVPGEVGYETSFADARLPRRFRLGFYRNDDGGKSPYYDANSNSAALTGKATATQDGARMGWYVMGDQTVLRGEGQRNLAVFGRYFVNTGNAAAIKWFASTGFVKTGTFAGRDKDTFSMFVSNTHFDDLEMAYLRDRRIRHGGTGTPHNDEVVGEINYGWQLRPGLRLLPNLQYVINPDPIYAPTRTTDIPDALIVGVRVDVQFAKLMGW
ncbi:carbohydrate porin [Pseudoxanthomonas sp. JBR18]|uniref:carbohydrate porin n=1 Tax=Pseudoxanthomonas sp. JBR18 TaxID=2969308 RepID=UPI002305B5F7|nr:carbohydrate porin [Pseudoxanthomonas sp. JBR18]WCE03857.1 carbohydrate porin [Pseudoxanthomonas sp. JBR18]